MNVFDCSLTLTVEPIRINKGIDSISDVSYGDSFHPQTHCNTIGPEPGPGPGPSSVGSCWQRTESCGRPEEFSLIFHWDLIDFNHKKLPQRVEAVLKKANTPNTDWSLQTVSDCIHLSLHTFHKGLCIFKRKYAKCTVAPAFCTALCIFIVFKV